MFLAKLSIKRPALITMLISVFIVFGFLSYNQLPVNLMPQFTIPVVTISTQFPGAGPAEIEQQITKRIEDAVSTVSGIEFMESYSMDNISMVTINFRRDKDPDVATQEMRDRIETVLNSLPTDARRPIVRKIDPTTSPVISMVLSGQQSPMELFDYANTILNDRFSQILGVASVDISGSQEREIQVRLRHSTLFSNMISLAQLSQIIADNNLNIPAGSFTIGNQDLSLRVVGEISDLRTLRELEIQTQFGPRRLSELAEIVDAGTEIRERTTFFDARTGTRNENVVRIDIIPTPEGNPVDISRGLYRRMGRVRANLPPGMVLTVLRDSSIFIESSIKDTMSNIIMGVILTGLILLIFLGDIRSTLIVALSMPISIISTFTLMSFAGFSFNMMSLLGLATSVGVLVINSIVILENIFRYKGMGYNKADSALKGTSEVAIAVLASTLTNLVVFIPIGTMRGMAGRLFTEFGLTVTFATLFSLLIAFTLTPMLASIILPEKSATNKISVFIDKIMNKLGAFYRRALELVMRSKGRSLLAITLTVFLFIASLFLFPKIGFEFMPVFDEGDIQLRLELPVGTHLDETVEVMKEIERIISEYPEVSHMTTNIGRQARNDIGMQMALSNIKLIDVEERESSTAQVADRMIRDLAMIPQAFIRVSAVSSMGFGGGGGNPISFNITGLENDRLSQLSTEIMEAIRDVPGLRNLNTSLRTGRPEIAIEPKRDQLAITGVTVQEIGTAVRAASAGLVTTQYRELGNEYDIRVTLDNADYSSPERLRNLTIMTSKGRFQLSQLADVRFTEGTTRIIHRDKSKAITITASPAAGVPLGDVVSEINARIARIDIPDGYGISWGGTARMMNETNLEMRRAFLLALLLLFMLLVAILESYVQPLLIMTTIPLSLIGVLTVQFTTGLTMNVFSMMAIIMLIGIVVNNAILILDFANQLRREEGKSMKEALLIAAPTKLKAILMTNIAIIIAMLPMALGMGDAGKEFRQAMGIVSIGGLLVSTVLALYVIPALSYITSKDS